MKEFVWLRLFDCLFGAGSSPIVLGGLDRDEVSNMMESRRDFLRASLAGLTGLHFSNRAKLNAANSPKPNVLFITIRNFKLENWPVIRDTLAPGKWVNVDGGPTTAYFLEHRNDPKVSEPFKLAFDRRPAEKLYDLNKEVALCA